MGRVPAARMVSRGRGNPEYNNARRFFELGCEGLGRMGRMPAAPVIPADAGMTQGDAGMTWARRNDAGSRE